jgi:hypothetical protein
VWQAALQQELAVLRPKATAWDEHECERVRKERELADRCELERIAAAEAQRELEAEEAELKREEAEVCRWLCVVKLMLYCVLCCRCRPAAQCCLLSLRLCDVIS